MSEQAAAGDVPEWDLADRMRKALRYAGIGPQEMADYLGVSRQSAGNWINGRVRPSFATLRLWSLRTGVSLGWLAGGDAPVLTAAGFKSRASETLPGNVIPFSHGVLVTAA